MEIDDFEKERDMIEAEYLSTKSSWEKINSTEFLELFEESSASYERQINTLLETYYIDHNHLTILFSNFDIKIRKLITGLSGRIDQMEKYYDREKALSNKIIKSFGLNVEDMETVKAKVTDYDAINIRLENASSKMDEIENEKIKAEKEMEKINKRNIELEELNKKIEEDKKKEIEEIHLLKKKEIAELHLLYVEKDKSREAEFKKKQLEEASKEIVELKTKLEHQEPTKYKAINMSKEEEEKPSQPTLIMNYMRGIGRVDYDTISKATNIPYDNVKRIINKLGESNKITKSKDGVKVYATLN